MLLAALLAYLLGLAAWWTGKAVLAAGYALLTALNLLPAGPSPTSPAPVTQLTPVTPSPGPPSSGVPPSPALGPGAVPRAPRDSADAEFEF